MLARRIVLGVILGSAFEKHITVYNTLFSKDAVRVGEDTYIGFDCNIGNADIGRKVLISDGVTIMWAEISTEPAVRTKHFWTRQEKISR